MIKIANNACSWGVWFIDDPKQPNYDTYLDEFVEAEYQYSELGTYGYMPTDPKVLGAELEKRKIVPLAYSIMTPLWDDSSMPEAMEHVENGCKVLRALGAPFYVIMDAMYTDLMTDEQVSDPELTDEQFETFCRNYRKLAAKVREYGVKPVFHPHACTHIETEAQIDKFRSMVPKDELRFCLDTGHHVYVKGNDLFSYTEKIADQIDYLHFKDLSKEVKDYCWENDIRFAAATKMNLFAEVGKGVIDWKAYGELLKKIGYTGYACIERDCYPPTPGECLKEQKRTGEYLESIGLGTRK